MHAAAWKGHTDVVKQLLYTRLCKCT